MLATYLALLRGVNLGGTNKLPMKDLRAMFDAAGCSNVQTFIQSGNVIFRADANAVARLPGAIAGQIADRFGYRVPVVLRTAEQLAEVASNNPFLAAGAAEDSLHVLFLADRPEPRRVAALDPDRSPPDAFHLHGQEVYLRLPDGAARTRLTVGYFDSALGTTSTGRNWRTVMKLRMLLDELAGPAAGLSADPPENRREPA